MTTVLSRSALSAPTKTRRQRRLWLRRGLWVGAAAVLVVSLGWALRPQPIAVDLRVARASYERRE